MKKNRPHGLTRRDVLQSMALAASVPGLLTGTARAAATATESTAVSTTALEELQNTANYYPPIKTGLRGTHVGAFEAAHQLRDGEQPLPIVDSGQNYDLVIVGGGISGLSAAWIYRQQTDR